jgi:hypothetical protein
MLRLIPLTCIALIAVCVPVNAAGVTGHYIEARTCDVWTGPCFANAEVNFGGKHAILGWKIDKGSHDGVQLDGLGVVAVVAASDTLGVKQTGRSRAIFIVDSQADARQRDALIGFAKTQAGPLVGNVVHVETAKVSLEICPCEGDACGILKAGPAAIETRCLHAKQDKMCGNETAFYPPLAKNVKVKAALAVEHTFNGKGMDQVWNDAGRRGAYVGSFIAH